jgi:hypothetical protein
VPPSGKPESHSSLGWLILPSPHLTVVDVVLVVVEVVVVLLLELVVTHKPAGVQPSPTLSGAVAAHTSPWQSSLFTTLPPSLLCPSQQTTTPVRPHVDLRRKVRMNSFRHARASGSPRNTFFPFLTYRGCVPFVCPHAIFAPTSRITPAKEDVSSHVFGILASADGRLPSSTSRASALRTSHVMAHSSSCVAAPVTTCG